MKFLKYLCTALEESPGTLSIMRIGFYTVILTACGTAIGLVIRGGTTLTEVALVSAMLTGAFGGKVWQSKYENELDV